MTTAHQQKQMFYDSQKKNARECLARYIKDRHKQRFVLVEKLRSDGKIDSHWNEVELFDKQTDDQEAILDDMLKY